MMKALVALAGITSVLMSAASGAAALELHVKKTITLDAPAAQVWDAVKSFDALNTWHPAVASDQIESGTNDTVGAVRLLTLKGGGTIKEKLVSFDDSGHRFRYVILDGVLPVSHYSSSLVVTALGNDKTLVTWSGKFKRKNLGDDPADTENDKAATDAISGVYQSGLDNLKKILAAK
jgi:mxaD protein